MGSSAFKPCFGYLIMAILLSASFVLAADNSEKSFIPRKVYSGHSINHGDQDKPLWFGLNWTPFPGFKWPPFPWPFPGFQFPWPFPGFNWPPFPFHHPPPPPLVKPVYGAPLPPSPSPVPTYQGGAAPAPAPRSGWAGPSPWEAKPPSHWLS
ncbi:hypothetical protein ACH5RR_009690 [Cinchona calisaya]|uniref:Uncharacterized protein n=1 Tax=Cinchona calisaya TaxID=153742 RepID=A0ABD3AFQ2_9GENT